MNEPISLVFSLRMFFCSFLNPSLDHLKQNNQVISIIAYFLLSKPWYINSEKKSSEKKIE